MLFEDRHLPEGLVLGLFRPEDAPGIVECYRNVHGDSFPVPDVYDAAAIIAHNSGDRCYTLVVRTPEGRVVGLAALHLVEQHRRVFEARQLMVAKDYRRRNLAKILNDANIGELPALLDAGAVFSELVCNTPASQKLVAQHGLHPTGLELECLPSPEGSKVSLLYMYKIFRDAPQTLYLPERYTPFVEDCTACLGVERVFDSGLRPGCGPSALAAEPVPIAGLLRLRVRHCGADFTRLIDEFSAEAPNRILQVQLDLADPAVPWATELLRQRGFFLGAYLPLWYGTDALMLQRLPWKPEPAAIALIPGAARQVLEQLLADKDGPPRRLA